MVWNQPSDNGQDRDPWGNNNTGKDKSKKPQGKPASPLFPNFKKELNKLLKLGKKGHKLRRSAKPLNTKSLFIPIVLVVVAGWIGSGLYNLPAGQVAVITRFGQVQSQISTEGLKWAPKFIDQVYLVNTSKVRELNYSGMLLTSDVNVVQLKLHIDYQVSNAVNYLFDVSQPDNTLQQIFKSAVNALVAKSTMHNLFTQSKSTLEAELQSTLTSDIARYNLGITINQVSIDGLQEPSQLSNVVKSLNSAKQEATNTATQSKQRAEQTVLQAKLQAQKIVDEANLYQQDSAQNTQAVIEKYSQLLPEYKIEPKLVKDKLYYDAMQRVLSKTNKVLLDGNNKNLIVLPTPQPKKEPDSSTNNRSPASASTTTASTVTDPAHSAVSESKSKNVNSGLSIFEQRAQNVKRLSNGAKGE